MLQPFTEYTKAVPINLQRSDKVWGRVAKRLDDGSTAPASPCPKDVNERYSQELMNMVMQKYQAAEVGTFNPNLPLPM